MKRTFSIALTLVLSTIAFAVNAQEKGVEMADTFRQEGKIYVVVAIVMMVLAGLIAYLFVLDRKISKMEAEIKALEKTK